MGIVRFALRFPHTFYVLAALILFLRFTAIRSMPTDIFPEIRIPVGTVIWQETALSTPAWARAEATRNGAGGQRLQPVLDQRQRQRRQEHGGSDPQRSFHPKDLLSA